MAQFFKEKAYKNYIGNQKYMSEWDRIFCCSICGDRKENCKGHPEYGNDTRVEVCGESEEEVRQADS